jgi:hypothetical protein
MYNRVIHELKHFVKDKRREKYYIAKLDHDNDTMFMYMNFTQEFSFLTGTLSAMFIFEMDCLEMWRPYLEKYERRPLCKPTLYRKIKRVYNSLKYSFLISDIYRGI